MLKIYRIRNGLFAPFVLETNLLSTFNWWLRHYSAFSFSILDDYVRPILGNFIAPCATPRRCRPFIQLTVTSCQRSPQQALAHSPLWRLISMCAWLFLSLSDYSYTLYTWSTIHGNVCTHVHRHLRLYLAGLSIVTSSVSPMKAYDRNLVLVAPRMITVLNH